MFFFSKTGGAIASAVERYIAITPGLTHYKSGYWKPISKGYVTKQLNLLRKLGAKNRYHELSLRAGDGDATDRAVHVEIAAGHPSRSAMAATCTKA